MNVTVCVSFCWVYILNSTRRAELNELKWWEQKRDKKNKSKINHSIISPLCLEWVRAPSGDETSQVLLAGVACVFPWGSPVCAQPPDWPVSLKLKNLIKFQATNRNKNTSMNITLRIIVNSHFVDVGTVTKI